jgi:predicted lipoprotein
MKKAKLAVGSMLLATSILFVSACSKDDKNDSPENVAQLKKDIVADAAHTVAKDSYEELAAKAGQLLTAVETLNTTTNDDNLSACRNQWKSIRETWEQTEAWLFGPVSVNEIDPRIDTWPVDFNDLNNILASSAELDEEYVDGLEESLKGFHPIEYLLWGQNGNKAAADLTDRQKEYLLALAQNLKKLCEEVKDSWTGGYATLLATAGASGNSEYPTLRSAYEVLVDGMAGICDEVANGKIKDPFELQDPTQEESPFAKNSITDFTNNIKGIMAMYQGRFNDDGKGLEDLVRNYNLSLDNSIKEKHAAAIASLEAISDPFGEAISTQTTLVQNAMDKINDLAAVLEDELKPFVQQYSQGE